jgi:phosphatidate cytidylyltransferase
MTSSIESAASVARTSRLSGVAPGRDAPLPIRVRSAVLFIPILIALAWFGSVAYLLFTLLVVGLALREFYRMMESKGLAPHWKSGFIASLLIPIGLYVRLRSRRLEEWHGAGLLTILLVAILLSELRRGAGKQAVANLAATVLGVFYIGWLGAHIGGLRELPPALGRPYATGMSFALLPFFLTWTCDTAAYAFGRALGRHRLMPSVSPSKSVEGAIGGFLASIAAGAAARAWFAPYLSLVDALVLGAAVGIFAQLGDLVESLLKRDVDTKDSSSLIPGHGGVLDRFDSLLFAAPLVYYFLIFRLEAP